MNTVTNERRHLRSDEPLLATRFYLQHLAQRLGCEALALSTADGLLVDGVGEGFDLDLLGALASLPSEDAARLAPSHPQASQGRPVQVHSLGLHGHPLFVASVGGSPLPVGDCTAALARIYAPLFS